MKRLGVLFLCLMLSGCQTGKGFSFQSFLSHFKRNSSEYTIKPGDTVYAVAKQYNVAMQEIIKVNEIHDPSALRVGQKLKIPSKEAIVATQVAISNKKNVPVKSLGRLSDSRSEAPKSNVPTPIRIATQSHPKLEIANKSTTQQKAPPSPPRRIASTLKWQWPARGKVLDTFYQGASKGKGIQIYAKEGTPVLAAADGQVVYSGNALRGYGNLIILKHDKNFLTAYAHNRKLIVKEGERVRIGQQIAEIGQSASNKVKLHFEVRKQGKPIDPLSVLPR